MLVKIAIDTGATFEDNKLKSIQACFDSDPDFLKWRELTEELIENDDDVILSLQIQQFLNFKSSRKAYKLMTKRGIDPASWCLNIANRQIFPFRLN